MDSDKLVDRLEAYSNAVLAFVVAQSLVFSFTFGVQPAFSCVIIADKILAKGLLAHFAVCTVLAVLAMQYFSWAMRRLSPANHGMVRTIFVAKSFVVAVFAIIPILLLSKYGLAAEPGSSRCARLGQSSSTAAPMKMP